MNWIDYSLRADDNQSLISSARRLDWLQFFGNMNSLKNFTCQPCKLKTQFTSPIRKSNTSGLLPRHFCIYSLWTLFNIIWLELEPLNAFLKTLLLGNTRQTSPMKLIKYLYNLEWIKLCTICCHFCINNTGMINLQETINGTERASPIYTLFHR